MMPTVRPRGAAVEHGHDGVEGVCVERAEALVDEERVDPHAAGLGGDHVGEAQGEGEGGDEALPAGERLGRPGRPVHSSTPRGRGRRAPRAARASECRSV